MKWDKLSKEKNLSEDFIREHYHRLDWNRLCEHEKVSDSFLQEMLPSLPHIPWLTLSYSRKMSKPFLYRYLPCLSVDGLVKNPFLRGNIPLLQQAITNYETYWHALYSLSLLNVHKGDQDVEEATFRLRFHTAFHPFLEDYDLDMTVKANIYHDTELVEIRAVSTTKKSDNTYMAFHFSSFPFVHDLHFSYHYFVKELLLKHKCITKNYFVCY